MLLLLLLPVLLLPLLLPLSDDSPLRHTHEGKGAAPQA